MEKNRVCSDLRVQLDLCLSSVGLCLLWRSWEYNKCARRQVLRNLFDVFKDTKQLQVNILRVSSLLTSAVNNLSEVIFDFFYPVAMILAFLVDEIFLSRELQITHNSLRNVLG